MFQIELMYIKQMLKYNIIMFIKKIYVTIINVKIYIYVTIINVKI